jgi:Kdo2-lipid IVA lauroyltransferase/acyltransferase
LDRARRHRLEATAARVVSGVVRRLPRRLSLALGRGLGRVWSDLDRRHVAVAVDNLRHAFPHWDEARLRRTARAVYVHFGQVLMDLLWLEGRGRDEVLRLVQPEGFGPIRELPGAKVFVTAHHGHWELHGLAHGWLAAPMGVVARPLDNPALDARLRALRAASGNVVIEKRRALQQVLRLFREGVGAAFLIDQNVLEKDGVFVDFFGRPAATTTVAAALALKTGLPIVAGHTLLMPDGRYRVRYEPPLRFTPTGDRAADVVALTQRLTSMIEGWVRETPEQWLWIHRRWKTRPTEAAPS